MNTVYPPANGKVLVEFDRKGSLSTTYAGQDSAMGLICGQPEVSILDPSIIRYKELAKERKLKILFQITDFEASHPNTYETQVENNKQEQVHFIAVSKGEGMIEMQNIIGFEILARGSRNNHFDTYSKTL
jgi:L-serine dehydratase